MSDITVTLPLCPCMMFMGVTTTTMCKVCRNTDQCATMLQKPAPAVIVLNLPERNSAGNGATRSGLAVGLASTQVRGLNVLQLRYYHLLLISVAVFVQLYDCSVAGFVQLYDW
jgi:hypothetical protein